jgi:hypothetical protein
MTWPLFMTISPKKTYGDTLYTMHLHSILGLLLIVIIVMLQVVSVCMSGTNGTLIMQHTDTMTPLVSAMILPDITVSSHSN